MLVNRFGECCTPKQKAAELMTDIVQTAGNDDWARWQVGLIQPTDRETAEVRRHLGAFGRRIRQLLGVDRLRTYKEALAGEPPPDRKSDGPA